MNIQLIKIKQDFLGFTDFFGSWVCQDEDLCFLVDLGPACSAKTLISSLASQGIHAVDFVLLTHIHIDHAGPLAEILDHYPMAKAVCYEKGLKFLIDPTRLWEGSLKVLGKTAEDYGCPGPVKSERLIPHTQAEIKHLKVVETPGHAPHHVSYVYRDRLFSGEAAGNYFELNNKDYMRPATPPRFFLETFLESVDHLQALPDMFIYYAHCGSAQSSKRALTRIRKQLLHWEEIIGAERKKGQENLVDRCINALLEKDVNLSAFYKMDAPTQQRERTFLASSIKGFLGYFQEKETS